MHQHADAGEHFPLVLLDAQMPGMDGFFLARQIQLDPMLRHPPIMMLSSLDLKSLSPELRETGHYVTKPVTRPTLLKALLHVLQAGYAKPSEVSQSISRRGTIARPLHVLVAEDNAVNQKVVARLLQKQGHSVVIASNGREALSAYAREAFDLILMDVQMPEMNGYETTQAIRTQEQQTGQHVPIIALTAHALKGDRDYCLQAWTTTLASLFTVKNE
jgi:two-component system, sensor histidine kinase and response regulator